MKKTKELLKEVPNVEENLPEDEKEKLFELLKQQSKLHYIRGRIDVVSELLVG